MQPPILLTFMRIRYMFRGVQGGADGNRTRRDMVHSRILGTSRRPLRYGLMASVDLCASAGAFLFSDSIKV